MTDYTVTITKNVSRADIENICITALEGGIGYWAQLDNTNADFLAAKKKHPSQTTSIVFARGLMDGIEMTFIDATGESPETWKMNIHDLLAGIRQYYEGKDEMGHVLEHRVLHWDDWDIEHADLAFQLGIFGQAVFG